MPFSSIAIFSPGLLGGSLALAIRERLPLAQVRIWARRPEIVEKVLARKIAHAASTDPVEIAKGARLIVFCMPIGAMGEIAAKIAGSVERNAVVTDVGSVKRPVVEEMGAIFSGKAIFIGSHPMAGSEQTGLDSARANLFEGAVTFVTPEDRTPPEAIEALTDFWTTMGCKVVRTGSRIHDDAVGLVSHLPHLVAAALVRTALRENPVALDFRGPGFMDTTRVASGPAGMWAEILLENRDAVKHAILAIASNLNDLVKLLDAGDISGIEDYLAESKRTRDGLKRK